jgi:hypothetical protein
MTVNFRISCSKNMKKMRQERRLGQEKNEKKHFCPTKHGGKTPRVTKIVYLCRVDNTLKAIITEKNHGRK